MFKKNEGYRTLYQRYQKHERYNEVTTNHCMLCFQDIQHHQDIFHFIKQGNLLCGDCLRQLKRINVQVKFDKMRLHILYEYNDFLENMIYQYKEGRDIALHNVFFHEDMKKINDIFRHYTVVFMPSSKAKMMERKFLPIREMLKECQLEVVEPFYKLNDMKQSLQSFEDRSRISQVIRLKEDIRLPNKKLLLVDDVCTSGSTLKWAYELLSKHTYKIEALVLCAHPRFVESCDEKGLSKKGRFSIL